jgi:hypothetical protein
MPMPRKQKANGAARSNGHAPVVQECPQRPADQRWVARLEALDFEAVSRAIAAYENPKQVKDVLNQLKAMQEVCARLLDNNANIREKLFRLEVQARRRLQQLIERLKKAPGPGRGKRIRSSGKLFRLDALGIERSGAYEYRDILKLQPANIDSYVTNCRIAHRSPTVTGLLNATRKHHKLKRSLRGRPWTEDRGGLFGCDVTEGDPSPMASAYEITRRFSDEDRIAYVACVLTDMSDVELHFITSLIDERSLDDFVQGFYERRERPEERRRFIAELMAEDGTANTINITRGDVANHRPPPARKRNGDGFRVSAVATGADGAATID